MFTNKSRARFEVLTTWYLIGFCPISNQTKYDVVSILLLVSLEVEQQINTLSEFKVKVSVGGSYFQNLIRVLQIFILSGNIFFRNFAYKLSRKS